MSEYGGKVVVVRPSSSSEDTESPVMIVCGGRGAIVRYYFEVDLDGAVGRSLSWTAFCSQPNEV